MTDTPASEAPPAGPRIPTEPNPEPAPAAPPVEPVVVADAPTTEPDITEAEVHEAEIVEPGTALVVHAPESGLPEPSRWEQMVGMSERLARSNLVPKAYRGRAADVLLVMLASHDLGISATQGFQKINVIEGRLAMSAELMVALVLSRGHRIWPIESTSKIAIAGGVRRDTHEEARVVWTLEDARRAGLVSSIDSDGNAVARDSQNRPTPWMKYPLSMLWARAVSQLCRMMFPDVLAGISYTPEELGSITNEAGDRAVSDLPPSERDGSPDIGEDRRAAFAERIAGLSDKARRMLADEWKEVQHQGDLPPLRAARECDVRGIEALVSRWEERDKAADSFSSGMPSNEPEEAEVVEPAFPDPDPTSACDECGVTPGMEHKEWCPVPERIMLANVAAEQERIAAAQEAATAAETGSEDAGANDDVPDAEIVEDGPTLTERLAESLEGKTGEVGDPDPERPFTED